MKTSNKKEKKKKKKKEMKTIFYFPVAFSILDNFFVIGNRNGPWKQKTEKKKNNY